MILADWAALAIENARLYEDAARRRAEAERAVRRLEATAGDRARGRQRDRPRPRARADRQARPRAARRARGRAAAGRGRRAPARRGRRPGRRRRRSAGASRSPARPPATCSSPAARRASTTCRARLGQLGVSGAATALLVPLVYRNTPLGLLAAFDRLAGDPAFDDEEERLFLAFAASAATAVATARSVAEDRLRHSIAAGEQERRRWARELHDETLQGLGGLQVLLSSALRRGDRRGARAVGARGDRLHRHRDRRACAR